MLADGELPAYIQTERAKRNRAEAEIRRLQCLVACADAWIDGLTDKEAFVIREHTMNEKTWREVADLFPETFGYDYTVDGLRKIARRALDKVYQIAS